ncbi:hypothetical protein GYM62_19345 [Algoriphagus sp. NBT04N3]|uniref:DUF6090 family protein n=1 Tax=Algoriphagus sp. NBT04N3 TaxID=2705473 RepID=UPI001C6353D7|nr:DUF6090 family protein [Algoriphagus sp. NBT04N3]QYH40849.1 hypothetical protein GYM62_19345 [Algoriphagus sp. NBT04N3]
MLRIFRHIRKWLMEERKIRRYLLYALGEILLVMIGILLALQVNNWNEQRKAKIKSITYHERILEDLDIFISETNQAMKRSTSIRNLILETLDFLESKNLPEDKVRVFENTLHFYYQIPYRHPSLTTLDEMRSNGDLSLIGNLDLRKKLIQLDQDILSNDEVLVQIGYQSQNPVFYIDQFVRSIPDTSSLTSRGIKVNSKFNFESMANDEKLINYFSKFSVQWSHHIMFSKGLNESANELREAVSQELENLK